MLAATSFFPFFFFSFCLWNWQMTSPLWQKAKKNKRASWWKWKRRVEKLAWNSTFRKLKSWHLTPSLHRNRWGNNGKSDRLFGGSKITADGDCNHKIKRKLFLGRKAMMNLDSILKSRDITLPIKVPLVKAMVFPVVMYGCETWNINKAECWRIDAFKLWCWGRFLGPLYCKEI